MNHYSFIPTPITPLNYYTQQLGVDIISKRDDLFFEAGGGSKARMLQYILADVSTDNCDVIVTAGGPCSNFNRACALMCARLNIPMHLIEYTDTLEEFDTSLNYYICNLVGIRKTRCEKKLVPETIDSIIKSYNGKKIKFIYGGGKSLEGIFSYFDAVKELSNQVTKVDALFVACGTGTTLTGICAGMQAYFPESKVYAISVARTWNVEKKVLIEDMNLLNEYLGTSYDFSNLVYYDSFLCGGYDKVTNSLLNAVKNCIAHEGMIVDPCYSGKAFYGMIETIEQNLSDFRGKKVLFWNTGGIFNLLSMKNDYVF